MSSFKVIIIGSGLAGSLLANSLARHNVDFEVYERAEKHSKREGFQIRLGEGALMGMRACLEQEQIDSIARRFACLTVSNPPIVYDKHFRKMFEPGKLPGYKRSTPINRVSLREALSEPLYKMGKLHNEKRLANYEIHRDGSRRFVKAFFDDDTSDTCDVLIGADGNGSKVNCLLGLNNLEEVSSYYGFLARKDFPASVFNDIPQGLHSPVGTIEGGVTFFFQVYLPREVENPADSKPRSEQGISTMLGLGWRRDRMPQDFDALTMEEKWDAAELLIRDWSPQHYAYAESLQSPNLQYVSRTRYVLLGPKGFFPASARLASSCSFT
ncbi:FAD dependent oxidoreductase [Colletotrichum camelliae]|nr:FAD dependent oxidoreductase [Colletotrichum camelliae]